METDNQREPNFDESQKALSRQPSDLSPHDRSDGVSLGDGSTSEPQQQLQESISYLSRTGPIPDPLTLREYNDLVPGFSKEFLASFLEESKHRRNMEIGTLRLEEQSLNLQDKFITGDQRRAKWGLIAGFIVSISALVIGGGLVYTGHDIAGGVIAGSTLPALTAVFVTGSLKKQEENKDEAAEVSSED